MVLFHGSNVEVKHPKIISNGFYKDFGYGFYCTEIEKQAKRWALTKSKRHIVNQYNCNYTNDPTLRVKVFKTMTEEWLEFVVSCRQGKPHPFDIVEGPMADDTIWDYIEDYITHNISKEAFWELVKFKYPTHQIVFCSSAALQTLVFERSYEIR